MIANFTDLEFHVEESQGFTLPATLNANDTTLKIESINNMALSPIKKSPMVGNGPFTNHRFCIIQYEKGTRTEFGICPSAADCNPPLNDPCNFEELTRCGCSPAFSEPLPFRIAGFQLLPQDRLSFIPMDQLCSPVTTNPALLSPFTVPSVATVSSDKSVATYPGVSSIEAGYYRICIDTVGVLFDVGFAVVRPNCGSQLVEVGGTCVDHCPKTKVPVAGACRQDPIAQATWDLQALMVAVKLNDGPMTSPHIVYKPSSDPERRYFIYRYTYELAGLLNCDPQRIEVTSLANGSVIVNTVIKPVGVDGELSYADERSPMALISLLRALQNDTSSALYRSKFFNTIDRVYNPPPLLVRLCDDGVYRAFCPYVGDTSTGGATLSLVFGILISVFSMNILCTLAWQVDRERKDKYDDSVLRDIKRGSAKPEVQADYALSWLEGRYMGEDWQKHRPKTDQLALKS